MALQEDKERLAVILQRDAAFLAAQALLDYSLLVGIYRIPGGGNILDYTELLD